jgi:hypothetical protein
MPAGYSGTPLAQKLGIKPGARVVVRDAPTDYAKLIAPVPNGLKFAKTVDDSSTSSRFRSASSTSKSAPSMRRGPFSSW